MNWLKDLINRTYLARAKAPLLRELGRAIGKLRSGETAQAVVPGLLTGITGALAGWIPKEVSGLLLPLVLGNVDWPSLLAKPSGELATFFEELRTKVAGARL